MPKSDSSGVISRDEAYSKRTAMQRLGIAQASWDKLLDEGLAYTQLGHTRWVTGAALIEHLNTRSERKHKQ
jgi:hypothetical protein